MCRGFQQIERTRALNIKAFHLKLKTTKPLPESLTLHYLPRINGSPLEINDSKIRPDSPAFVTLHRLVSSTRRFGSRERVVASEGVRFEVYLNDEKALKGVFRKNGVENVWKIECTLESSEVTSVEVFVDVEGGEKVEMVVMNKRRKRCFSELEEIIEMEMEGDDICCCNCDDKDDDGDEDCFCEEIEKEVEGMKWAVDVGIWVVCLGVGYLVTRRKPRRR